MNKINKAWIEKAVVKVLRGQRYWEAKIRGKMINVKKERA